MTPWVVSALVGTVTLVEASVVVRSWVAGSTAPPRKSSAKEPDHTRLSQGVGPQVLRVTVPCMAFTGFPIEGVEFYEQLAADNSRAFWQANKARYDEYVKQPMLELTVDLAEFGPIHLFRPYNDVRFSKNKPPYKTQQGAYGESEGGTGYDVQLLRRGSDGRCGLLRDGQGPAGAHPGGDRR